MVIGDWSDRAARNRPSSGRLEVAPPGKVRGAGPSQSARETRPSKRRPEGRRPSRRRGRRRSGRRRSCRLSGIGSFKEKEEGGTGKSPAPDPVRNRAGIVRQRHTPRCRCRRGDPCGRPTPERRPSAGHCLGDYRSGGSPPERRLSTVRRPLLGHYGEPERRLERRLSRRRLGSASFRAPGVATDSAARTMRPRRAPTRGAPTIIGELVRQGG